MPRDNLSDLHAFIAVARASSFTRAAAKLGASQPALSYTVRELEKRLGVRLLMRSTRGVSVTEAGQRLLDRLAPEFDGIEQEIQALSELRDQPMGTVRISASDFAIQSVLWPKLRKLLAKYPDIRIELISEYESIDIVERGFDAGVQWGHELSPDMISLRIGPDVRMAVVGAKSYLLDRPLPKTPQDLLEHLCINLCTSGRATVREWDFAKGKKALSARVEGSLVFNNNHNILEAAKAGFGLAYLPQDMVRPLVSRGQLVSLLQSWCPLLPGLHLYYPNRRQPPRAMTLLLDAVRYKS